jgi:hypothetical protein
LVHDHFLNEGICPERLTVRESFGCGKSLFRAVCDLDLEGIIAKRLEDPYDAERTKWWKVLNPTMPGMTRAAQGTARLLRPRQDRFGKDCRGIEVFSFLGPLGSFRAAFFMSAYLATIVVSARAPQRRAGYRGFGEG